MLLTRHGYSAQLRIGVARAAAGPFKAHAWVECAGTVIIGGGSALGDYTPLPALEARRA